MFKVLLCWLNVVADRAVKQGVCWKKVPGHDSGNNRCVCVVFLQMSVFTAQKVPGSRIKPAKVRQ